MMTSSARHAVVVVVAGVMVCLAAACNRAKPEELAARTAEQYYTYLLQGNYDAFVDGCYQKDTIRAAYRKQLVENAKMIVHRQEKARGGIKSFVVAAVEADAGAHTANVFLDLSFGDGTSAQVLLPMVEKDGLWLMR